MPDLDQLRRMVVAKHTLQIGHRGHRVTYHLIPPGERVGDVQSVLSSPHEGLIEQLLSELDRLRSRVEESEQQLAKARGTIERLRAENDRLERSLDKAWRDLEP